ncbi:MAG: hypothetical protein FWD85_01450 [Microbacteriaceae bacterium]|nr:hypothetical protein [Microbacteriaceae bacterium]MCL2793953.1 hypothetical protein [Microbacteriaceae bacterium]
MRDSRRPLRILLTFEPFEGSHDHYTAAAEVVSPHSRAPHTSAEDYDAERVWSTEGIEQLLLDLLDDLGRVEDILSPQPGDLESNGEYFPEAFATRNRMATRRREWKRLIAEGRPGAGNSSIDDLIDDLGI